VVAYPELPTAAFGRPFRFVRHRLAPLQAGTPISLERFFLTRGYAQKGEAMSVLRYTAAAIALLGTAATASAQTTTTTTTTTVTKKVERSGPLKLTPQQRTVIYRTVSRERRPTEVRERRPTEVEVIRERRPTTQVEVIREPRPATQVEVIREPRPTEVEVVGPPTRVAPLAPAPAVDVTVGRRMPEGVVLSQFPQSAYAQAPGLQRYRYYYVNNRLMMVDPVTSEVVDIIEQ
jgi:hypothetical protein